MDIRIIDEAEHDLFQAATPQTLAEAHPLWAGDLNKWGSWSKDKASGTAGHSAGHSAWRTVRGTTGRTVYIFGHCVSSLDVGWHLVERDCLSPWDSVLALSQWDGRGQLRRNWSSPAGNIFAALRIPWPPGKTLLSNDLTGMVTAYAIIRAFEQMGLRLELKWPNDLLLNGKVGGVLIEERQRILLAGIGINLAYTPNTGAQTLQASNLSAYLQNKGPLAIWTQLAKGIRGCFLQELACLTEEALIERMDAVLAWKGKKVRVVDMADKAAPLCGPYKLAGLAPAGGLYLAPCEGPPDVPGKMLVTGEGSLIRAE